MSALLSSARCRADALKLGGREGRGSRETDSSGQMEPCLFWSSCCWEQDSLPVPEKDITPRTANLCFLLVCTDLLFQLCCPVWKHSMQLKVRKLQQQQPQGTVPSGSWDPQRQVGIRLCCSSQLQYRDSMQSFWTLRRMWGRDYFSTSHDSVVSPCLVLFQRRGGGMGPTSLQEEREPKKGPKEEMESYHYLLQAGSQLQSTLQREYTRCWPSSFNFRATSRLLCIIPHLLSNCFPLLVCPSRAQQTEAEMYQSTSLIYSVHL